MFTRTALTIALIFWLGGSVMAKDRIVISSAWGEVRAELNDNEAAKSLLRMLPVTIQMRDHLRQEKTGNIAADRLFEGHSRALDFGSLRRLLPRRAGSAARDRYPRTGER
jgi:Cyclophilin-like family